MSDWKKEIPLMNAGKLPIYIVGWQADYPGTDNFIAAFYWSGGQYMYLNSNPGNATADKLYRQSLKETDPAKQIELYKQIIENATPTTHTATSIRQWTSSGTTRTSRM